MVVLDECREAGAGEHAAEDPDGKDVAGSYVEVRGHGDGEVEGGRSDEKPEGSGVAEPAAGDGEEGERERGEESEGGLDEEDYGEVVPDAVLVDVAEEEAGHVVGHLADVGEAVEVAFGEEMEAGGEEEAAGLDAGERANVVGERGREGEGGGAGGVAEAVESPEDDDADEGDDGKCDDVVEGGAGQGGLLGVARAAGGEGSGG